MAKRAMQRVEGRGWPGMVLDHQSDMGGEEFKKVADWWHPALRPPEPGFAREDGNFAAHVKIANMGQEVDVYPLDTPEDAYASALYFYRWGLPVIGSVSKTAALEVERSILDALLIYGVEFPVESYKRACYEERLPEIEGNQGVWAGSGLPVTTPQQTAQSCAVFEQYESHYKAADRIKRASKLKAAADMHGVSWDHDLAIPADVLLQGSHIKVAQTCEWALDKRAQVAIERGHSLAEFYCSEIERIKVAAQLVTDYEGILKLAEELEGADLMVSMQGIWGDGVPDPARTILTVVTTPQGWLKQAQQRGAEPVYTGPDWNKLNFDKIASDGLFSPQMVEELKQAPNALVPRLDISYQSLLTPYLT